MHGMDDLKTLVRDLRELIIARPWMLLWPAVLIWRFSTPADERSAYIERALTEYRTRT